MTKRSTKGRVEARRGWYLNGVKRAADIGTSLVAIAAGAIPIAISSLAICVESHGAPIFRQERVGKDGVPFGMWKLRTMYADAEANVESYLTEEQQEQWERERKVDDDPRVTKVGNVLRKISVDELPQFINVLVGDMSVVGPRPVTADELEWFGDDAAEVLSVRPGVTGWWQAYARNDATWESGERQNMELYYVRNMSLLLDLRIFFHTFVAVFKLTGR
ncbi:MAG: sugar transferase [Atopobiaceae bacterium]|nr:sugar transferase [Atopobiaceae bacterium]MBR3314383.1 sugar transferase [Atopobiaceae bacterium]